jgi:hypothetical protein
MLPWVRNSAIQLPPIEWTRLPVRYQHAGPSILPLRRTPASPTPRRVRTTQSLPTTSGQVHRIMAADRVALAEELLARFRALAGN